MRRNVFVAATLMTTTSCTKETGTPRRNFDLPATPVPERFAGTWALGNIAFDEGFTAIEGSFVFHAGRAYYNGSTTVKRDVTAEELTNYRSGCTRQVKLPHGRTMAKKSTR